MEKNLPSSRHYYSIGEAAQKLGVAIDTVRRWEKSGRLHADRTAGGMRLFSIEEIERLLPLTKQQAAYLTVSQAATYLDVSPGTLRRWDKQDRLKPLRTMANERVYTPEQLKQFMQKIPTTKVVDGNNPVDFFKNKVEGISDSVLIGLIDKSAYSHYRAKLLPYTVLLLFIGVIIIFTSLQQKQVTISPIASNGIVNATTTPTLGQDKLPVAYAYLPSQTNSLPSYNQLDDIAALSPNHTTIVLHANPTDMQSYKMDSVILSNNSNPTLPTTTAFSSTKQLVTNSANILSQAQTTAAFNGNYQSSPLEIVAASSLVTGSATIPAGKNTVFVPTASMNQATKVFLSPTSGSFPVLTVSQKISGQGFWVTADHSANQSLSFDWLLIN